jgi:hypothetical protein
MELSTRLTNSQGMGRGLNRRALMLNHTGGGRVQRATWDWGGGVRVVRLSIAHGGGKQDPWHVKGFPRPERSSQRLQSHKCDQLISGSEPVFVGQPCGSVLYEALDAFPWVEMGRQRRPRDPCPWGERGRAWVSRHAGLN